MNHIQSVLTFAVIMVSDYNPSKLQGCRRWRVGRGGSISVIVMIIGSISTVKPLPVRHMRVVNDGFCVRTRYRYAVFTMLNYEKTISTLDSAKFVKT